MRVFMMLLALFLMIACQAEPEKSEPAVPPTAQDNPSREPATVEPTEPTATATETATETATATATATETAKQPATATATATETATETEDKRPAPSRQTPTLPLSANAKPVKIELSDGASLVLPKGTREIKVETGGDGEPTTRHYYLNHPLGRGLKVTEYPLKGRRCGAIVAARESAYEAGYANKDPQFLELHDFHRGGRCTLAQAACYFSDTSRRSPEEAERGVRLHREAAYLLCKDDTAVSIAWKVPAGAEVTSEVIDALTRIAGTFSTP